MISTYHTTTPEIPEDLCKLEAETRSQDKTILGIFKAYPYSRFTADEITFMLRDPMLITSIRRALTDLEDEGEIKRVGFVPGIRGRLIGAYQLVSA